MFEHIKLIHVDGKNSGHKLILFGLTTCGYCKRALSYLNDEGFEYDYIFLDEIPFDDKQKAKDEFKTHFGKRMTFPTLIIDQEEFLIGFIQPSWDMKLKES